LIEGTSLALAERPGDEPALVLIPGTFNDCRVYSQVVTGLDPGRRTILVEHAGHGRSRPPASFFSNLRRRVTTHGHARLGERRGHAPIFISLSLDDKPAGRHHDRIEHHRGGQPAEVAGQVSSPRSQAPVDTRGLCTGAGFCRG
jgi:pimeloyl-ACP methyl ester carboxylesterase